MMTMKSVQRELSDSELKWLAARNLSPDIAWKYIDFIETTDFTDTPGAMTVNTYAVKTLFFLGAWQPAGKPS
jgi:hypothetical protein